MHVVAVAVEYAVLTLWRSIAEGAAPQVHAVNRETRREFLFSFVCGYFVAVCTDHKHTAGLQVDTHVVLRSATNIYSEYLSLSPIRARDPGVEEVRYVKFGK